MCACHPHLRGKAMYTVSVCHLYLRGKAMYGERLPVPPLSIIYCCFCQSSETDNKEGGIPLEFPN